MRAYALTHTRVCILNQAWESHCWHLQARRLPALCTGASACTHIDAARAREQNTYTEIKSNSTSACLPLIHESDAAGVCQYARLREMFIYRKLFIRYSSLVYNFKLCLPSRFIYRNHASQEICTRIHVWHEILYEIYRNLSKKTDMKKSCATIYRRISISVISAICKCQCKIFSRDLFFPSNLVRSRSIQKADNADK